MDPVIQILRFGTGTKLSRRKAVGIHFPTNAHAWHTSSLKDELMFTHGNKGGLMYATRVVHALPCMQITAIRGGGVTHTHGVELVFWTWKSEGLTTTVMGGCSLAVPGALDVLVVRATTVLSTYHRFSALTLDDTACGRALTTGRSQTYDASG